MKAVALVSLVLLSCSPAQRQASPADDKPIASTASDHAAALRAHLEFITHDLLEGRDTGTRGYDLAARYAASQFRAAGLEPGGDDGTFLQSFDMRRATLSKARLTATKAGKTRELKWADEFIAGPSVNQRSTTVRAKAVFAGFGVVAPKFGIDDYAGLDVKGKIVVLLFGGPAQMPSEPRAHHSGPQKVRNLHARGAAAVLWIHSLQMERTFPYAVMKEMAGTRPQVARMEAGKPYFDPPYVGPYAVLNPDTARALFTEAGQSFDDIRKAADANPAQTKGFEFPMEFELSIESDHAPLTSANVVGVIPGSDPKRKDEVVVVSAHLDHLGVGKPVDGDAIYNGAIDNGTGSAMVIELGRAMKTRPSARTVALLLVTGEERGLLGSKYFARNPSTAGTIVANVNLDVLFWEPNTKKVVFFGEENSSLGKTARDLATSAGYEVIPDPFPEQGYFTRSDHYSFVEQGIPSIYMNTGFDDDFAASNAYRKDHYHRPSDQLGKVNVDYAVGAKLLVLMADLIAAIGNEAAAPTWTPGNFFGELFGNK